MSGFEVPPILIVDDDPEFGDSLEDLLALHGHRAITVRNAAAAMEALSASEPAVVMLDIRLGVVSGVDLLARLQAARPGLICIMMTAHADTSTAVQALRHGAYDYVEKAGNPAELMAVLARAIETHQLRQEKATMIAALTDAKLAAETANRAKSDFLATMSHELRTPLNAIIGFSELILQEAMGPLGNARYYDYVKDINTSGQHLLAIVNDLLDLTKAEAGRLELTVETISLRDVVGPPMRLLSERASNAGLTLAARIADDLPAFRADERKVKQVLLNLLSNAVKFTPAGGRIEITAGLTPSGDLAIAVKDTGIGIASEHFGKVFEPFGQVDNMLTRSREGTGLGLPLVKAIMELHGGGVQLDSTIGVGTTVTITVPAGRLVTTAAKLSGEWPGKQRRSLQNGAG